MRNILLATTIILLGAGSAFAADTDSGTAGRPTAVLSEVDCVAAWQTAAGAESTRFHRGHDALSPAHAIGIVTNFQQADADNNGSISREEFTRACKLGLVTSGLAAPNTVADY
jgi:hypothetical protein